MLFVYTYILDNICRLRLTSSVLYLSDISDYDDRSKHILHVFRMICKLGFSTTILWRGFINLRLTLTTWDVLLFTQLNLSFWPAVVSIILTYLLLIASGSRLPLSWLKICSDRNSCQTKSVAMIMLGQFYTKFYCIKWRITSANTFADEKYLCWLPSVIFTSLFIGWRKKRENLLNRHMAAVVLIWHGYLRVKCIILHLYSFLFPDDMLIKLWDWDKKWSCTQVFEGHAHYVMQIVINPKDNNTFASASLDRTVKVSTVDPHMAILTVNDVETIHSVISHPFEKCP